MEIGLRSGTMINFTNGKSSHDSGCLTPRKVRGQEQNLSCETTKTN